MRFFSNLKIRHKIAILPVLAVISLLIISGVDYYLFRQLKDMSSIFQLSNKFSLNLTRHMQLEEKYIQIPNDDLFQKIENNRYSLLIHLENLKRNSLFHEYTDILDRIISTFGRHNFLFIQVSEIVMAVSLSQKKLIELFHDNDVIIRKKIDQINFLNKKLMSKGKRTYIAKNDFSNTLNEFIGLSSEAMLNTNELFFFSDFERYMNIEEKGVKNLSLIMSSCRVKSLATGDPDDVKMWRQIKSGYDSINLLRSNIYRLWKRRQELSSSLKITHNEIQSIIEKLNARVNDQIDILLLRHKWTGNITILSIFIFILVISIILIQHITKPVQALTATISKFKNRDFNESLKIYSNDEIGLLTNTLNEMIQHRRQGEKDLQESEKRFRFLAENARDALYRMTLPDGKYEYMSPAAINIFGYSPEDFYNNPKIIQKIMHPDWQDYFADQWQKLLSGDMPPFYEYMIIDKSGKERWLYQRNALIRDEAGNPAAIEGIVTDITERKQSEKILAESEAKFRDLFDFSPQPISLAEVDTGRFVDVNEKLCELTQYSKKELLRMKATDILYSKVSRSKLLKELREFGEVHGREVDLTAKDGSVVNIVSFAKFIKVSGETYILTVWLNVTERRKLEMQLQQSQKMESIGTLAGGIAHDFNNILGVILGNAELAIYDFKNSNLVMDGLQKIRKACLQARDIVKQILVFSRKSKEEKKQINISKVIEESFQLLRTTIPTTIEIKMNIMNRSDVVNASSSQINRVLFNLCSNASHAMREKGGILEVTVEGVRLENQNSVKYHKLQPGRYIKISVKDTGPGIEPEILEHIFEPYFTTKGVGEGSGMGLAVVHGIVKDHSGDIFVESEIGKGTIFEILLPCVKLEVESAPEDEPEIRGGIERILFVDDEKSIVSVFQMMLERLGYMVTCMTGSLEALEYFKKNSTEFDLVITDMNMPDMNGADLTKKLIQIRPDIPVILCTGYSDMINKKKAKKLGIMEFIMKPLSLSDIAKTIRNTLDKVV